ncbi:bis(5'-nucleosyl)-tetraphosphatase [asymmetrical]-like isoform X2 [Zootermopsis nevadensis]|uniref:bis(5'-nucleosyl)-tetraphosphatase [asymmetrical]-like isoform X2 n=1 Tax=Zootermopsis nevadensis TaxID=136037 RepID=UPI000B8EA4D9|nr:bis(5'-nucleosyl)-tetraphosphatase [asymmetrical]-like isoform X2 [Zootermopsis nevadensis]XP_021935374.1 bis(5'-nucleosyl)-tetraphosphatase [asymmetrical]-like isoform X2 [Zootermopsis nevadensis]
MFTIYGIIWLVIYGHFQQAEIKHKWEFKSELPFNGHVDPGESDLETALRETEEESGLRKMDLHIIEDFNKTIKYNVRGTPKTAVYLLAELIRLDTPVKLSDEHQDFKWVPLDKACKLVEHQTLQEVLKECSTFLQQNRI